MTLAKRPSAAPALLRVEEARQLLAEAKRVDDAKAVRDKAEAIEIYLRRQNASSEAIADAQEIKLWAERRIGELTANMEKAKPGPRKKIADSESAISGPPTLQELLGSKSKAAAQQLAHRCEVLASVPEAEFKADIEKARQEGEKPGAKIRRKVKKAKALKRVAEQAEKMDPIGEVKPCPVVYADPPWRYGNTSGASAAEDHYPTMALADICALKVPATKDAVLFLWATSPLLPDALQVMAAWGFAYKGSMVWVKPSGTGNWVLNHHEFLLIGVRGAMLCPEPERRPVSVIDAKRGAHSAKPEAFAEAIERMYPELPKVEMFARKARAGWSVWGNQAK